MQQVGIVKEIWRYPVKGMAGESLQRCEIGPSGLRGDRLWALRDSARREIQSCKFRPALLRCTARYRDAATPGAAVDIRLPDGTVISSDDATIHQRLSALAGHDSTLEPLRPLSDLDFYRRYKPDDHSWLEELKATFDRAPGEPLPDFSDLPQRARDFVSIPGTFFLVMPFHLVTSATLTHLQKLNPDADWNARRFRANVVIETARGTAGLAEQAWIGRPMLIGDTHLQCVDTTVRCGAITRAQDGIADDTSILRTVVRHAAQNVGVYASVDDSGELRVGDAVKVG